jgi:opacity protein-like surface antigen
MVTLDLLTRPGFLGLAFILASGAASAQVPGGPLPNDIPAGEQVVVSTMDGHSLKGRVQTLSPSEITILTRDGRRETLSAPRVGRIVVKDPVRNGVLIGTGVGVAAGIAGAALVEAICENETGGCPSVFFILGGIGAGAGAALGAGIDGLNHRVALDLMPDVPSEYSPEVFATAGGGLFATRGRRQPSSPSVGGSWLIRHSSGLALELDVTRGLTRTNRAVACVKSDAPQSGSLQGACVASGEEGVSDTSTGAAKGMYYFSRSRIQPYVGAGVGLFASTIHSPEVTVLRGRPPFVAQVLRREVGAALVAGTGLKIAVSPNVSVRPDITLYKSERWTQVRFAVGAGYAW